MGETNRLGVATAALGIMALRAPEPSRVLADLTAAALGLVGAASGAALAPDLVDAGTSTAGPESSRSALLAGFEQGPGADCARNGRAVTCRDLDRERARWLTFVAKAAAAGTTAAWALPIRHGTDNVGALLLIGAPDDEPDLMLAAVLAEAAAVALLRAAELDHTLRENAQLRAALTSRIVLEQAKGMLAEHAGLGVEEAFDVLRTHARRNGHRLGDLAGRVARREITPASVMGGTATPPRV